MAWWKQPNAWCAVITFASLVGVACLELGRTAAAHQFREVTSPADAISSHSTFKPVLPKADTSTNGVADVIGTPAEDVLLHNAKFESLELVEQVKALRELYIRLIRELPEQDASLGDSKDARATSTDSGRPT